MTHLNTIHKGHISKNTAKCSCGYKEKCDYPYQAWERLLEHYKITEVIDHVEADGERTYSQVLGGEGGLVGDARNGDYGA